MFYYLGHGSGRMVEDAKAVNVSIHSNPLHTIIPHNNTNPLKVYFTPQVSPGLG